MHENEVEHPSLSGPGPDVITADPLPPVRCCDYPGAHHPSLVQKAKGVNGFYERLVAR